MIKNNTSKTNGCHHIGLSVSKLDASATFFTDILGWQEVRRDNSYPAIFVSDGFIMVTLWQSQKDCPQDFDKNTVGLHHVAFMVNSEKILNDCYQTIKNNNLKIEFSPELLRDGPAKHMICYEPSGIRVELIWPGHKN
jgi:catechol 2,3-dioxygenase-like lactoylglutathione lyase family enzyme